jgi:hypothetical protein
VLWPMSHFELVLVAARGIRTCLVAAAALALSQRTQGVSMIFAVSSQNTRPSVQLKNVSGSPPNMSRSQMGANAGIICTLATVAA